jgi:hypothetical protein
MKIITPLLCAAALAATSGCVMTETTETRSFNHSGFDAIDASGGVNLVLKQGPFAINAEGPKSKLDKLVIQQQGTTLSIHREHSSFNWFSVSTHDVVTITAPTYTRINATGGVDVETAGLTLAALTLGVTGGADFDADNLQVDQLTVETSGGGDVRVSGACKLATVNASGGADFDGKNFTCQTATVTSSAGADVEINASQTASGDASSGADIRFYGNPTNVTRNESSGGDVEVKN